MIGVLINKPKGYEQDVTLKEAGDYYVRVQKTDPAVMAIFGTNLEVTAFNEFIMKELELVVKTVTAEDVWSSRTRRMEGHQHEESKFFERAYQEAVHNISKDPDVAKFVGIKKKKDRNLAITCEMALGMPNSLKIAEGGSLLF